MAVAKPTSRGPVAGGRWVTVRGRAVFIKTNRAEQFPTLSPQGLDLSHPDRSRQVEFHREMSHQFSSLSVEDKEAVKAWAHSSSMVKKNPQQLNALEKALDKVSLPDDVTVFRATTTQEMRSLPVGKVVRNPNFASTSKSELHAVTGFGNEGKNALLEIRLPKGTNALDLSASYGISQFPSEFEVLVQRKQRYRVVEVRSDRTVLELLR